MMVFCVYKSGINIHSVKYLKLLKPNLQGLKEWVQLMKLWYQCWIIYSSDTNCPCHFLSAQSHNWSRLVTNCLLSSAYFQQSIKHVWFCSEIKWYHFLNIHLVFYLSLFQHWFSWWLLQRLGETWHTSHLEMLNSWEMFMKYTLSSPTNKSPLVRLTSKTKYSFVGSFCPCCNDMFNYLVSPASLEF